MQPTIPFLENVRSKRNGQYLLYFLNLGLILFQFIYLNLRFNYLNNEIPFWYTKPWSVLQLAPKGTIYTIPVFCLTTFIVGFIFMFLASKYFLRYGNEVIIAVVSFANIVLTFSMLRLVQIASAPFTPLINPLYLDLIVPFILAFLVVVIISPLLMTYFKSLNIITNPARHSHPGMILKEPSTRGGGLPFTIGVLSVAIFFVALNKIIIVTLFCAVLLVILSMLDDYQNTHIQSKWRFIELPFIRLFLLLVIVSILVTQGLRIEVMRSLFGGVIMFESYAIDLGVIQLSPLSSVVTIVWIVWVMNVLSWSNGVDGQYSGVVGVVGIVTAILAFRYTPPSAEYVNLAKLAIIVAGASLGLLPYMWHPSKMMWGYGAVIAGFLLSVISILINSKIATSVLIILIPFLDGSVIFIRRLLQGKNPLRGDRGHLHHLLLEWGFSVPQIAIFYWISTALFGVLAVISSDRYIFQLTMTLSGIVAFSIILLNVLAFRSKHTDN